VCIEEYGKIDSPAVLTSHADRKPVFSIGRPVAMAIKRQNEEISVMNYTWVGSNYV
jgi:hypothetical protein